MLMGTSSSHVLPKQQDTSSSDEEEEAEGELLAGDSSLLDCSASVHVSVDDVQGVAPQQPIWGLMYWPPVSQQGIACVQGWLPAGRQAPSCCWQAATWCCSWHCCWVIALLSLEEASGSEDALEPHPAIGSWRHSIPS